MPTTDELELAFPDINAPVSGGEPSFRRILVPVRAPGEAAEALAVAARVCSAINGVLRLVHVRIYDPPLRGAGRFYPETAGEAAAVLDEALLTPWASGLRAATAVVNAPRGQVAAAIAGLIIHDNSAHQLVGFGLVGWAYLGWAIVGLWLGGRVRTATGTRQELPVAEVA